MQVSEGLFQPDSQPVCLIVILQDLIGYDEFFIPQVLRGDFFFLRERVIAAQARQYARQNRLNARLDNAGIRQFCSLNGEDAGWLPEEERKSTLVFIGVDLPEEEIRGRIGGLG